MTDAHGACAWARRLLTTLEPEGPVAIELVKQRAWSTVWRLETPNGRYYLKHAAPGFDIEAPLLVALCGWRPAAVVDLVAAEVARGWVLTRDAGRLLHDVMFDDFETGRAQLKATMLAYAELQIEALRSDAPALSTFLENRSPTAIPHTFAQIVEDEPLLIAGGATKDELVRRCDWLRNVERRCTEVASLNLPVTLDHGDLHTSNIMISAQGTPKIADWGDSCWAPMLHALVTCLDDISGRHKIARDDPWLLGVTEDYFDAWRSRGYDGDFARAIDLTRMLSPASAVLQWARGIDTMRGDARAIMAGHIVKHLRALDRQILACPTL